MLIYIYRYRYSFVVDAYLFQILNYTQLFQKNDYYKLYHMIWYFHVEKTWPIKFLICYPKYKL